MAKIKNPTNRSMQGRIGDLIFYELNGQACVRSRPSSYKDKKSEKQILHRKKFATIGKLFSIFRPAIRYDLTDKRMNPSSLFSILNWKNVIASLDSVSINYEQMILCNKPRLDLFGLNVIREDNKVVFSWEEDNLQDDSLYVLCAVFCRELQRVYVSDVKRFDLFTEVHLPTEAEDIVSYAFSYRRDSA